MADFIVAGVLLIVIGAATAYIAKEKKKGVQCIGCPASGNCAGKNGGHSGCSCGCQSDMKTGN